MLSGGWVRNDKEYKLRPTHLGLSYCMTHNMTHIISFSTIYTPLFSLTYFETMDTTRLVVVTVFLIAVAGKQIYIKNNHLPSFLF